MKLRGNSRILRRNMFFAQKTENRFFAAISKRSNIFRMFVGLVVFLLVSYVYNYTIMLNSEIVQQVKLHRQIVDQYYEKRRWWKTSNLGAILFKNYESQWFLRPGRANKTYSVVIWKYYDWLKQRHVHSYHSSPSANALEGCSVSNCVFSANDSAIDSADAVLIHMQRGRTPEVRSRPPHQRWVFLSDESALHTFTLTDKDNIPSLSKLANVFNWTMTFRSDSDIPVPYGRTVPLREPNIVDLQDPLQALKQLVPHYNAKQFDVPIAILASNCISSRMEFVETLGKYVAVDMHGKCSATAQYKNSCPGHFREDCPAMARYPFYLVYENSKCRQYLTEKAFYHGYAKGAIPIIIGPSKEDCETLLPPNSYIHIDDYGTPENIANKIFSIVNASDMQVQLLSYHKWRMHFEVLNEHGYFGTKSVHFCRVCEALNYNSDDGTIYTEKDLQVFFDPEKACGK